MGWILYDVLNWALNIIWWLLLAYVIVSWIPDLRRHSIVELLSRVVDTILLPFRRLLSLIPSLGTLPLDLSPLLLMLVISLVRRLLPILLL